MDEEGVGAAVNVAEPTTFFNRTAAHIQAVVSLDGDDDRASARNDGGAFHREVVVLRERPFTVAGVQEDGASNDDAEVCVTSCQLEAGDWV